VRNWVSGSRFLNTTAFANCMNCALRGLGHALTDGLIGMRSKVSGQQKKGNKQRPRSAVIECSYLFEPAWANVFRSPIAPYGGDKIGSLRLPRNNPLSRFAKAVDPQFDHVARLQILWRSHPQSHPGRCAGADHVARQ
jgi:hypothetical protein